MKLDHNRRSAGGRRASDSYGPHAHADGAALGGCFARILEQIDECLQQALSISPNQRNVFGVVLNQKQAVRMKRTAGIGDGLAYQGYRILERRCVAWRTSQR